MGFLLAFSSNADSVLVGARGRLGCCPAGDPAAAMYPGRIVHHHRTTPHPACDPRIHAASTRLHIRVDALRLAGTAQARR